MKYKVVRIQQNIDGFTLVELLVVIAIIALLLSILMPALNSARENSKRVQCGANMRQIGLAINIYLDENQQTFPYGMTKDPNGSRIAWVDDWGKSLGKARYCPSQQKDWYAGYAYNLNFGYAEGRFFSPVRGGPRYDGVRSLKVNRPSEKVVATEASLPFNMYTRINIKGTIVSRDVAARDYTWNFQMNNDPSGGSMKYALAKSEVQRYFTCDKSVGIHKGMLNFVYADCHVGPKKTQAVTDPWQFWPYLAGNLKPGQKEG